MSNKIGEFRRAVRACFGKIVGFEMNHGFGATMVPILTQIMRGDRVSDQEIFSAFAVEGDDDGQRGKIAKALAAPTIIAAGKGGKATALVSMRGIALYDCEYQPICYSTALLAQTMTALANDPEIGTIILDIDSPGGYSTGVMEAADAVFAAREVKRVVALINPLCASAAYWIGAQASEIAIIPSGDAGSIGVYRLHVDCSKMMDEAGIKFTFIYAAPYKVEGNAYEPLGDEARAYWQTQVDQCYADFVKAVARGRGVSVADVKEKFGAGRCMSAQDAKRAGLVDRVASAPVALQRWGISMANLDSRRRGEKAEATTETPEPITFQTETDGDVRKVFVVGHWPDLVHVDAELFTSGVPGLDDLGEEFRITTDNGEAIYGKCGTGDAAGTLIIGRLGEMILFTDDVAKDETALAAFAKDNPETAAWIVRRDAARVKRAEQHAAAIAEADAKRAAAASDARARRLKMLAH